MLQRTMERKDENQKVIKKYLLMDFITNLFYLLMERDDTIQFTYRHHNLTIYF